MNVRYMLINLYDWKLKKHIYSIMIETRLSRILHTFPQLFFFAYLNKVCCFFTGADALEASIAAVSKYGGASSGYRTMLDALIPASTVLKQVTSRTYFLFWHHYV